MEVRGAERRFSTSLQKEWAWHLEARQDTPHTSEHLPVAGRRQCRAASCRLRSLGSRRTTASWATGRAKVGGALEVNAKSLLRTPSDWMYLKTYLLLLKDVAHHLKTNNRVHNTSLFADPLGCCSVGFVLCRNPTW